MRYLENELYCKDIINAIEHTKYFEYFNGKRILILGAAGLIGSFITDCFIYACNAKNMDIHMTALGRSIERLNSRFGNETDRLKFMQGDVTKLDINIEADVIIHAASYAYPRAFREKPVETMLANMLGTHRVMEIARKNYGCRVLYVSTGEVQEEVNHLSTRACYPVSKKAGETLCLAYLQEYKTDVVIARPCHTFGANITSYDNRATAQFIESVVQDKDIIMKSAGQQMRSFVYVADCVSGLLTILASGEAGQVYEVSSDETCSVRQFAEKCASLVQKQVIYEQANETERAEASPIKQQILDNYKLKLLGWSPQFSIDMGIVNSVEIQRNLLYKRRCVMENLK